MTILPKKCIFNKNEPNAVVNEKDAKSVKLIYSGAKRTLYIVRNDTHKLIALKGNRKSIGGIGGDKKEQIKFTNYETDLFSGDSIYLSTDGIIDQNGPDRMRFGSKKFEDLIVHAHTKPIDEQKKLIELELSNFMDNEDQRDDITIIGLQIK